MVQEASAGRRATYGCRPEWPEIIADSSLRPFSQWANSRVPLGYNLASAPSPPPRPADRDPSGYHPSDGPYLCRAQSGVRLELTEPRLMYDSAPHASWALSIHCNGTDGERHVHADTYITHGIEKQTGIGASLRKPAHRKQVHLSLRVDARAAVGPWRSGELFSTSRRFPPLDRAVNKRLSLTGPLIVRTQDRPSGLATGVHDTRSSWQVPSLNGAVIRVDGGVVPTIAERSSGAS